MLEIRNAESGDLSFLATPLMLAAAEGRLAVIQYLLKNGADQELKDHGPQF